MSHLANNYLTLGRREEALRVNEQVISARKRVLPPGHPLLERERIGLETGSGTMRSSLVLAPSFSERRRPPFGTMLLRCCT